jgi:hypothetical protein
MLLLYAQSGAGKTSLLNAGVIPLLEEEGFEVLPLARVQGSIPKDIEPKEIPNLYIFNTLMSWAGDKADPKRLAQMSLTSFLKEREQPTDEMGLPSPRIVIFDQFEELFAFYTERWRDREGFFKQVRDALEEDPLFRVVFVMREDYIAQLDPEGHEALFRGRHGRTTGRGVAEGPGSGRCRRDSGSNRRVRRTRATSGGLPEFMAGFAARGCCHHTGLSSGFR